MGGQSGGNRQDNRQRGNAAQLLEKYKSMARDAQLGGDRVQTEYYLQFAEHYYRVLGESRARFEEQRRQRGDDGDDEDGDEDMMDADGGQSDGGDDDRSGARERFERPERGQREPRGDRSRHFARDERGDDDRSPRNGAELSSGAIESLPFDALPPAIGQASADGDATDEEDAPRPRRRARRPRADGDGEIAPAA